MNLIGQDERESSHSSHSYRGGGGGIKLSSTELRTENLINTLDLYIRWCIQKFPDWTPGARTVNGKAL
jgi:hypothetical protein